MTIESISRHENNLLLIYTKSMNIPGLDLLINSTASLLLLSLLLRSARC